MVKRALPKRFSQTHVEDTLDYLENLEQEHLNGSLEKVLTATGEPEFDSSDSSDSYDAAADEFDESSDRKLKIIFTIASFLTIASLVIIFVFFSQVMTQTRDLAAMQREHTSLLRLAEVLFKMELTDEIPYVIPYGLPQEVIETVIQYEYEQPYVNIFDAGMRAVNPDFIAWMIIDGTVINHPVVRGADNEKYLNTSFYGTPNMFGTLFMDYRNVGDYVPHIIIYGHNARNEDMFGSLHYFLDEEHMAAHPIITLLVNGRVVEYEIFSARKTDVNDPEYFLDFNAPGSFDAFLERINAPANSTQIITLSTCVSRGNDDERVIVQGSLRVN